VHQGAPNTDGYASSTLERHGKYYAGPASRIAYYLHYGAFDEALFVCHTCDTRACVRPDHLFLGTVQDNSRDMVKKGRSSRGARNGNSRFTDVQVQEMRTLYARGISMSSLARLLDVQYTVVECIIHEKTYPGGQLSL
jgi:hypothetical protein